jgi:3-deoxy-7-phosphoheptulonate synthase
VNSAAATLAKAGLPGRVVIDCSHANSGKDHIRQAVVATEVAQLVRDGLPISGVMLESFLVAGAQSPDAQPLTYGQSVTDKCMDWAATDSVLRELARG